MKLFYQLSSSEQDQSISHCAELIVSNAIEHGLDLEVDDNDPDGEELKAHLDDLFEQLEDSDIESKNARIDFLMKDEAFSETVLELASEMAYNAFYHEPNELVIYTDAIIDPDMESDDKPAEEVKTPKKMLN